MSKVKELLKLCEGTESFRLGGVYKPRDKDELKELVKDKNVYLGNIEIPSRITDLSNLFRYSERTDFSGIEIWDVSHVTNMSWMFDHAHHFNVDISRWDVSNVTNMEGMFRGAEKFNQPLNKWDVSNVTEMSWMFKSCRAFNQPLDNWDVSKVTYMKGMFSGCWHFNQPLKKWNLKSIKNTSEYDSVLGMFFDARDFNQDLSIWEEKYNINLKATIQKD